MKATEALEEARLAMRHVLTTLSMGLPVGGTDRRLLERAIRKVEVVLQGDSELKE